MNSQAIAEFVENVSGFGPVRAKALRNGTEERLSGANVVNSGESLHLQNNAGDIEIALSDIEQIIFSPEKHKYFVHLRNGLVEVRPDGE